MTPTDNYPAELSKQAERDLADAVLVFYRLIPILEGDPDRADDLAVARLVGTSVKLAQRSVERLAKRLEGSPR